MNVSNILGSFNTLFEKVLKSIESELYKNLDKIVDIAPNILKEEPLKKLFFSNKVNGIILIADSLIMFYICYFIICTLISMYNGKKIENVYVFILKMVVILILVNSSYYICEQILEIFKLLSDAVEKFGKGAVNGNIDFVNLNKKIKSIKGIMKDDALSMNGIIRGVISFVSVNIMISFCIRYVTVILLVLFSPIAIMLGSANITRGIFKSWIYLLLTNLSIQILTKLILIIPLAYKSVNSDMYKMIIIGSMYLLHKQGTFVKELISRFKG